MNLLKEVLAHEVYPAFGCTEPISCSYAAATAAAQLGEPVESLLLMVDPGTYKNGAAVTVPHSNGVKGNLIAAALGAVLARPDAKLEILQYVTDEVRNRALTMCDAGRCQVECLTDQTGFHIEVAVRGARHHARCVLAGGHTNVVLVEKDGQAVLRNDFGSSPGEALRCNWRRWSG